MTPAMTPQMPADTAGSVQCIILNWRTAEMTLRSVEAALTAMAGIAGGITVVDNASGDGSFEIIRDAVITRGWQRVEVIAAPRNGGFGAGNNVGIRAGLPAVFAHRPATLDGPAQALLAGDSTRSDGSRWFTDYVYVLNSDAFPAPDAIAILRDHLDRTPAAGFAGSHIHGEDGETHLTTFRFPSALSELEGAMRFGPVSRRLQNHAVPRALPDSGAPVQVDWLAGASLMMRRGALEKIGLFDEVFFLYFEETDLCLRLNRAGWQVHYLPDSHVMHIGSVSTGMKKWARVPSYWFNSRWHYFLKNHGRLGAFAATAAHLAGGAFHRLRCAVTRKTPADPPHFWRSLACHDLRAALRPAQTPSEFAPLPESRHARL